jgi:outer membrane receptor for ferrienterochelin and colicins
VIVGLLGEKWFETPAGTARVFINFENIGDVRQTRYDPLVLPSLGKGGRWTTDAWTELSGFTVNGGVRMSFGR